MKYKNKDFRAMARTALLGNYSVPIASQILITVLTMMVNGIFGGFLSSDGVLNLVLNQVVAFVLMLLMNIFSVGLNKIMLHISRGENYSFGDLLYFFRTNPDRVIVAGFVISLIQLIAAVPLDIVSYQMPMVDMLTLEKLYPWIGKLWLALIFEVVAGILFTLPLSMTYWILCDHPEMSGMDAIKESCRLMKGQKLRYLGMMCGFIPHCLLAVFSFGIAVLWIIPYMNVTQAFFYRSLTGEFTPYQENREEAFFQERADDFNSEA